MRSKTKQNIILFFATYLLCWLVLEVALRLLMVPAKHSYGKLLGVDLPPFKLITHSSSPHAANRSARYENLVVDGQKITTGDLWGIYREDPLIGFVPQENIISINKWWQTNNIGARSRQDIPKAKPCGQKRILVFGESFAAGSRVRQEDAWASVLDIETDNLKVVNFGADGYGMGQSFLRYKQVKDKLDYDSALLMFVPGTDLWRDINIRRDIGGGWDTDIIMPRFVIENGELKLIENPFSKNEKIVDDDVRSHLRKHDRFYSNSKYEDHFLIRSFITYKILSITLYNFQRDRLRRNLRSPGSEAMQVSKKIFEAMNDDLKNAGKQFLLVILPTHNDLERLKQDTSYRHAWGEMVAAICHDDILCTDLSTDLLRQNDDDLDKGYDGTHYGPKANYIISKLIKSQLRFYRLY